MNLSFIRFTRCYHFYLCWPIMNNRSNWTASKNLGAVNIWVAPPLCVAPPLISLQTFTITWDPCTMPVNGTHGFERKKTHTKTKPNETLRLVMMHWGLKTRTDQSVQKYNIIFYFWSTAMSNCPEHVHNSRTLTRQHALACRCVRGSHLSHVYVTHCLDRFSACGMPWG